MSRWHRVCRLDDIAPGTGVAALLGDTQVALFRVADRVFALDNRDPYSGACVLCRGIIGDAEGQLVVASPIYKQRFGLATGRCLDGPHHVRAFGCRVAPDGGVEISA